MNTQQRISTRQKKPTIKSVEKKIKKPQLKVKKINMDNIIVEQFKKFTGNSTLIPPKEDEYSTIKFNVNSTMDLNTKYNVYFTNSEDGILLSCNCGDKWKVNPRRNNCKHIGDIIYSFIKKYVENSSKLATEMDDINNLFEFIMSKKE